MTLPAQLLITTAFNNPKLDDLKLLHQIKRKPADEWLASYRSGMGKLLKGYEENYKRKHWKAPDINNPSALMESWPSLATIAYLVSKGVKDSDAVETMCEKLSGFYQDQAYVQCVVVAMLDNDENGGYPQAMCMLDGSRHLSPILAIHPKTKLSTLTDIAGRYTIGDNYHLRARRELAEYADLSNKALKRIITSDPDVEVRSLLIGNPSCWDDPDTIIAALKHHKKDYEEQRARTRRAQKNGEHVRVYEYDEDKFLNALKDTLEEYLPLMPQETQDRINEYLETQDQSLSHKQDAKENTATPPEPQ